MLLRTVLILVTLSLAPCLAIFNPRPVFLAPPPQFSAPVQCAHTSRFVFSATTELGTEPWFLDGDTGEITVHNIYPGLNSSNPTTFTSLDNGLVLFTARDEYHGTELWVTDCTPAGTSILLDLTPGTGATGFSSTFVVTDPNTAVVAAWNFTSSYLIWTNGSSFGTCIFNHTRVLAVLTNYLSDIRSGLGMSDPFAGNSVEPCFGDLFIRTALNTNSGTELYRYTKASDTPILWAEYTWGSSGSLFQLHCRPNSTLPETLFVSVVAVNPMIMTYNGSSQAGTYYGNRSFEFGWQAGQFTCFYVSPGEIFIYTENGGFTTYLQNSTFLPAKGRPVLIGGWHFFVPQSNVLFAANIISFIPKMAQIRDGVGIPSFSSIKQPFPLATPIGPYAGMVNNDPLGSHDWLGITTNSSGVSVTRIMNGSTSCPYPVSILPVLFDLSSSMGAVVVNTLTDVNGTQLEKYTWSAGREFFADLSPGMDFDFSSVSSYPRPVHSSILFTPWTSKHGRELFAANATDAWLVKDINPGCGSSSPYLPGAALTAPGQLFFSALGTSGVEPHVTDGTFGGTKMAVDAGGAGDGVSTSALFYACGDYVLIKVGTTNYWTINELGSTNILPITGGLAGVQCYQDFFFVVAIGSNPLSWWLVDPVAGHPTVPLNADPIGLTNFTKTTMFSAAIYKEGILTSVQLNATTDVMVYINITANATTVVPFSPPGKNFGFNRINSTTVGVSSPRMNLYTEASLVPSFNDSLNAASLSTGTKLVQSIQQEFGASPHGFVISDLTLQGTIRKPALQPMYFNSIYQLPNDLLFLSTGPNGVGVLADLEGNSVTYCTRPVNPGFLPSGEVLLVGQHIQTSAVFLLDAPACLSSASCPRSNAACNAKCSLADLQCHSTITCDGITAQCNQILGVCVSIPQAPQLPQSPGTTPIYSCESTVGLPPGSCNSSGIVITGNVTLNDTDVIISNPVVIDGNLLIGANVSVIVVGLDNPVSVSGCVQLDGGHVEVQIDPSTLPPGQTSPLITSTSGCFSGRLESVDAHSTDPCFAVSAGEEYSQSGLSLVFQVGSSNSEGCAPQSTATDLEAGGLAGIVIGGAVLVAVVVTVAVVLRRRADLAKAEEEIQLALQNKAL